MSQVLGQKIENVRPDVVFRSNMYKYRDELNGVRDVFKNAKDKIDYKITQVEKSEADLKPEVFKAKMKKLEAEKAKILEKNYGLAQSSYEKFLTDLRREVKLMKGKAGQMSNEQMAAILDDVGFKKTTEIPYLLSENPKFVPKLVFKER
jgi:DNA-directed RNA polymerase